MLKYLKLKIMNEKQKKYLNCLNEIYELTKDDFVSFGLTESAKKHDVHLFLTKIVTDNFLYKKRLSTHFEYKWKTIKPNMKMVNKCIIEISKMQKERYINNKQKLLKSDSKPRLDFINYFKSNFSNGYHFKSIEYLIKEHKIARNFTDFLLINDYILRRTFNNNKLGRQYEYKWNTNKDYEELKKLILESDTNHKKSVQPLQPKVEKVITKNNNIDQIKVYEDIIRMISNDLDAKDKKIEELEKMLSLSKKKTKQKSTSIFWGLIKITK